jgi:hypothetical protein
MAIKFIDHTEQVKAVIAELAMSSLEEAAGELESQVKQNTVVDTGKTKNSWQHRVTQKGEDYVAAVGSDYENSIWEEFGTGEYALNGDGRKGGWAYEDPKTGETIWTRGKRPRRPFHHAYTTLMPKIIKFLQDQFKGRLS